MYVNSNQKIFFYPFRVVIPRSDDDTSQVRSERCAAVTTAGRTVGKSQKETIWKKGLSFFGWGESKGSFFLLTFYGVKVKNTPWGVHALLSLFQTLKR